jgi:hypothetical protein
MPLKNKLYLKRSRFLAIRPTTTAAYPPSWPKETKKIVEKEKETGREIK